MLQAAYVSDRRQTQGSPSSVAAVFGNVCHAVLEAAALGRFDGNEADFRSSFENEWQGALNAEVDQLVSARWGPPTRWPGYALRKVRVRRLCRELVSKRMSNPNAVVSPEEPLRMLQGRLRGRPDLVTRIGDAVSVEDYKSGSIYEVSGAVDGVVKEGYRRQMILYAALCREAFGVLPVRAALIPLDGTPEVVSIDETDIITLPKEAIARLAIYNDLCHRGASADEFATPGCNVCRFCPFASVCRPFWDAIDESWSEEGVFALRGLVTFAFTSRFATLELAVDASAGSCGLGIHPIHAVHISAVTPTQIDGLREGRTVRVTGLRRKGSTLVGSAFTRVVIE
jgi:PD-(D/E)XK nuclease superfamily